MQEIQARKFEGNVHAYITDKLKSRPILITEEGETPFVAINQEQWFRVFDYLEKNGLVEEIFMENESDAFEEFKEGWEQIQPIDGTTCARKDNDR